MNAHVHPARLLLLFVTFSLLPAVTLAQKTYYVNPSGSDQQAGTQDAPWATLAKASQEAEAGDTVVLQAGTYEGTLDPAHSGTSEAPIIFRAAERHAALLVGGQDGTFAVDLTGAKHIRIEGLYIRPDPVNTGRWMNIEEAAYITVEGVLMEHSVHSGGGVGNVPFNIVGSHHVRLLNSIVREKIRGDMMHIYNAHHLLFEGNAISRAGHSPMAFSPRTPLFKNAHHIVVRGNVFHAGWGRAFEFFSEPSVLFENNIITHAYNGRFSGLAEAKIMLEDGLVRFNRVFRNWGSPLNMGYFNKEASDAHDTYFYNNVFDDNYDRALRIETVSGYVFKNNIFSRNDSYGGGRQLLFTSQRSSFVFTRNAFWAGDGDRTMIDAGTGALLTLETVASGRWRSEGNGRQDNVFRNDNLNAQPDYVAPTRYNHALSKESPLRDAGAPLTTATGSGSGTELPVEDARYFYEGFDIEGEQGDLIAVGADQQKARVVDVDRATSTLTLDRRIRWSAGDPVGLPWAGTAPDLGVYAYGATARPSVQITTEPFAAEPGEPVELRAVVRGDAEPVSYHWRIGDQAATGPVVTRSFDPAYTPTFSPNGAPVFCRVATAAGDTLLGTGFVEFKKAKAAEEPLVHVSFDKDPFEGAAEVGAPDNNWWWFWDREDIGVYELAFEDDGNGVLQMTAENDGERMAVQGSPGQWNIDTYPKIVFRYRLDPALPMGLYVQGFDKDGQMRRVYVAVHEQGTLPPSKERAGDKILVADGAWHQIEIDARLIREYYPEVEVLERIRFEAVDRSRVEAGARFGLDAFYLAPEGFQEAAR